MQTYRDVVANRQGVPVPGASILVKTAAGALASLFDTNGASIANPITSVDGSFAFAAANGDYVLNIASFGGVVVVDGIQMYDPADDSPLTQAQAAASSGASKIGYGQRTIENKLGEFVSVKDAPFNAKGDGATDDTAAIQAAINEVKVTGARLEIPPGIYVVSGDGLAANGPFSLHGASMDQVWLKNANGSVLRIQGNGCSIDGISLWSQGGGHTVVQTGSLSQSNWTHYRIRQDAADYSGWDNAGFEYVDNRHSHFDYVHAQGSSKAFFNLVAAGGLINDNEWRAGRTNNSGIHFFRIRSTSANWQYANKFDKITFEVCKGGGIDLQGAMLFEINDCQNWDCGANSITNHFYSIQLNADSIGSVGRIRSCGRWAGGNVAGIYDVQLPVGGGGAGISIEDCTTPGGGDPFTVDCRNNSVLVHGTTPTLMSLVNADGCLSLQASGAKPGLQWAAGNANVYSNVADTVSTDGTLTVGVNLVAGVAAAFGGTHTVRKDSATLWTMWLLNGSATPRGLNIAYDGAAPNSTTSQFIQCGDSGAVRMEVRSNGGIANFSANDVNLSDVRLKTDIVPAASYWDKVKAIEVVTYRYKDQTDPALNLGVIAQQVQSVAPELVDTSGFGKPQEGGAPYMAVYQTDLGFAAIKALQEVMARLEALEAKVQ